MEGHYTSTRGGAIFNDRSNISIENSTFKDNSAAVNGGAISNSSGNVNGRFEKSTINVNGGVTFTNNQTNGNGGAIYNNGILNLNTYDEDIYFDGNTASGNPNDLYNTRNG